MSSLFPCPPKAWSRPHQILLRVEANTFIVGGLVLAIFFGEWRAVLVIVPAGMIFGYALLRYYGFVSSVHQNLSQGSFYVAFARHRWGMPLVGVAGHLVALLPSLAVFGVIAIYELMGAHGLGLVSYLWVYAAATGVVRGIEANCGPALGILTNTVRWGAVAAIGIEVAISPPLWVVALVLMVTGLVATVRQHLFLREGVLNESDMPPDDRLPGSPPVLTIFPAPDSEGHKLAHRISIDAAARGYRVEIEHKATKERVYRSCLYDDATVFDASFNGSLHLLSARSRKLIEETKRDFADILLLQLATGRNLLETASNASVEESVTDNLSAGSTMLKSAYAVTVSGDTLPLSFPSFDPIAPPRNTTWTTDALAERVNDRLAELRPGLPRPNRLRGLTNGNEILAVGQDALFRRRRRDIFVSYRGHDESDVARLSEGVIRGQGTSKSVRFLRRGELAGPDELLSELRRWEILVDIRRWIWAADEIWIYDTADYIDSWWTRAELILLAMAASSITGKIFRYDPARQSLSPVDIASLPQVGKVQRKRIEQRQMLGINPGYAYRMRNVSNTFLTRLLNRGLDEVLSSDFRDNLLLQCEAPGGHRDGYRFDVEAFLNQQEPALHAIPAVAVQGLLAKDGAAPCPVCGKTYMFTLDTPRFRWYPVRNGLGTGPDRQVLEKVPTVLAVPCEGAKS
jgi:hypothetical protein